MTCQILPTVLWSVFTVVCVNTVSNCIDYCLITPVMEAVTALNTGYKPIFTWLFTQEHFIVLMLLLLWSTSFINCVTAWNVECDSYLILNWYTTCLVFHCSTVIDICLVVSACVWLCVCMKDLLPTVCTNVMQDIKEIVFCQMLILFCMSHFKQ